MNTIKTTLNVIQIRMSKTSVILIKLVFRHDMRRVSTSDKINHFICREVTLLIERLAVSHFLKFRYQMCISFYIKFYYTTMALTKISHPKPRRQHYLIRWLKIL